MKYAKVMEEEEMKSVKYSAVLSLKLSQLFCPTVLLLGHQYGKSYS